MCPLIRFCSQDILCQRRVCGFASYYAITLLCHYYCTIKLLCHHRIYCVNAVWIELANYCMRQLRRGRGLQFVSTNKNSCFPPLLAYKRVWTGFWWGQEWSKYLRRKKAFKPQSYTSLVQNYNQQVDLIDHKSKV